MSIHVKVGNVARNVFEIRTKVGSQIRNVYEGYVKVGTQWRYFFRKIVVKPKEFFTGIDNTPAGSWISGVQGAGNRVVVIGNNSNRALYSDATGPRRQSWKETFLPTMAGWQRVTYGAGRYVAISTFGNRVAWSTNGTTWYSSTLPYTGGWGEVAFIGGMFIATQFGTNVGDGGNNKLAWSTDGVTWNGVILPIKGNWTRVRYNGSIFVCVSAGSRDYIFSGNGKNWSRGQMPQVSNWSGLEHKDGVLISIGGEANVDSNLYAIFKNGQWSTRRFPRLGRWATIGEWDGEFVVAQWIGSSGMALVSADGESWRATPLAIAKWTELVKTNNGLMAIGPESSFTPRYTHYTTNQ